MDTGRIFTPVLTLLPDNSLIVSVESDNYGLIINKMDNYGDTIWSKHYSHPSFSGYVGPQKTMLDTDGNLFCVMDNIYLVKLDTGGNVLSTSVLSELTDLLFRDAVILPGGDKLVFYLNPYDANTPGVISCIDKNLNTVKWSQAISFYSSFFSNIVISGSSIFIGGGGTDMDYQVNMNTFVSEFDAANGSLKNLKYYKAQNSYSNLFSLSIKNDQLLGVGYFANGSVNADSGRYFYLRLDTNLNILTSKRIVNTDYSSDGNYILLPQNDFSIFGVYGKYFGLSLFNVNQNDIIDWVKSSPGVGLTPVDLKQNNDGYFVAGFDNGTGVGTNTSFGQYVITKVNFDGEIDSCRHDFTPVPLTLQNYIFNSSPNTMTVKSYPLSLTAGQTTAEKVFINEVNECSTTSICDSLKIYGDSIFCNLQNAVFTVRKNKDCHSAVNWHIVPSSGSILQKTSDSTISVQFTKGGNYKLYSSIINSCDTVNDTMNLHATVLTSAPNLGPDTVLCAGNSIILHAAAGFSSYKWQDGSADSVYRVIKPGTYSVSVGDYCGNIYNDTINVSQAKYNFSIGNDTTVCANSKLALAATPGFFNYQWSPSYKISVDTGTTVVVSPETNTNYTASAQKWPGCYVYDTISISVLQSLPVHLGNDTSFCSGDSVTLNAGSGFINYSWSNSNTSSFITVKDNGSYFVSATNANGCISTDTIQIHLFTLPVISLPKDSLICDNTFLLVDAGSGYKKYIWQDGTNGETINISSTGVYWVQVTDNNGCKATDSLSITRILPSPSDFLPADTTICNYVSLILQPLHTYLEYLWSDGATSPSIIVKAEGTYTITVTDKYGCKGTDSIHININNCLNGAYFANAFTPNGDGSNDIYRPIILGNVVKYHFAIYNRYGELIYESANPANGWDGTFHGKKQDAGSYVWLCDYQFNGQKEKLEKGYVVLIR